ncbi:DMT family transporter [Streptomyces sp. H10-C2]|uniref:DMT family transporter n=1 Tax=unclassified Streptomyces TaxID=2593676 RepID=UPI0024B87875|nr:MULTISPECIES: DMT family transporter [unclassified Streptomyces]MDJ0344046.1 DMT family transporter [Streptomyces sp. PH10-H1]MDJ0368585.1 DMT family transporter [Streptomyces sp. H10-C2]
MNSFQRRGALLAALACVLVGGSFTANGALTGYPHAGGQALRYGIAFVLLALITLRGATRAAVRLRALTGRQWLRIAVLAATGMVGFNLSILAAEATAEPAVPGVLVGCAPIVVAVLVPLLNGRRPERAVPAGALLVAGGAFAVQGWGGTDTAGLVWSVAALAGEVAFAVVAVPLVGPLGPRLLSTCVCGLATAEAGLLGLLLDGRAALRMPEVSEAVALGWQVVVATVIGFVCWYAGMQRIGAERATLFSGLIPVSAALTAPLVGVGTFGPGRLGGSLLVAAGVAVGSGMLARRTPSEHSGTVAARNSAPPAYEDSAAGETRNPVTLPVTAGGSRPG